MMENWGPYLRPWFNKLTTWCQLTFKNGTFFDFLYTFTINCVGKGAGKMPIEYMFCFICSEQCIKIIL